MVEVRPPRDADELQAAMDVRLAVFVEEQDVPLDDELDGRDDDAEHLVALEDGRVLATLRLLPADAPGTMKLQRLAVSAQARRRGLASRLIEAAESRSRAAGYRTMVLDAQLDALPLYHRHGYAQRGGVFLDAGIEHVRMEKALA
ncbi:MAG: GNAT family N-acetyltransferase [Solirubrobacterales bacterium]|nr:GNAT family N-acetyltransferase [Solirubrobacterales bacterium]